MMQIIAHGDAERWDAALAAFPVKDIYYMRGYVEGFRRHGDGEPVLMLWSGDDLQAMCVMMKRDIAADPRFAGHIPSGTYFDMTTPYGYGGFIFSRAPRAGELAGLREALYDALRAEGVISAFFRFHPLLGNADASRPLMEVVDLGKTIAMDTSDADVIWANISSKNRNVIRKAERSGVVIHEGSGKELFDEFVRIYNATMDHDHALPYYYFAEPYYESVRDSLADNHRIFYAELDGRIISAAIMLYAGEVMHYHLSGSVLEYRPLAPSNLLLYRAAVWASEHGIKAFHLGGGVGSGEDNLYKFKAAFNRRSDCRFSIGRMTVDPERYAGLVAMRTDEGFDSSSSFFPLYRS